MLRKSLKFLVTAAAATGFAGAAGAATVPVDLTSWSALTLDFPGGQPAGNWNLESGNTAVRQTVNADPSFYLNNLNQTNYSIDGSWQTTNNDDDYMGFVFGYQNSSNFYLFDWKRGNQGYSGQTALAGMTIKKFTGGTGDGLVDLSLGEFWENTVNVGDMMVLATNHGAGKGWNGGVAYDFHLDFGLNPNEFSIVVKEGATTLWNVTITDSTFTAGQFGFYNYSQANVLYQGFEQTGGEIVAEPGMLALFGLGLVGLGFAARRRRMR